MKTILVVDDEPRLRQLYRDTLEDEGYCVAEAEGAQTALRVLETQGADLAILDIRLPGTNGLELLTTLHATRPQLPIVLCSGLESLFDEYAVWEAGGQIVGKFGKPVDLTALVRCVGDALGAPSRAT